MILLNRSKVGDTINRLALGIQSLVVASDVESGDFTVLDVSEEERRFELRKGTDEEKAEAEKADAEDSVILLTDRFSPIKNLTKRLKKPTKVEITFMGDLMYVELNEGALFAENPESPEHPYLLYRHMEELDNEENVATLSDEFNWVTTSKLKDTFKRWCRVDKPEDYIFIVEISNEDGVVSYKPVEMYDISLGEIEKIVQSRENIEKKRNETKIRKAMQQPSTTTYSDDGDEYDDLGSGITDEDDDEEYDGYIE